MEQTFDTPSWDFRGKRIFPGFLRMIRPYVRTTQRILDVGAGNGHMIGELKAKFPGREAVGSLVADHGLVARMGERSRELADAMSWRSVAGEYEALYEAAREGGG